MGLWLSLLFLAGAGEITVMASRSGDRVMLIVDWPDCPAKIQPGQDYRRSACFAVPSGLNVHKIATFIGNDRGNLVEADVQVYTPAGYYLLQRSEHRETPSQYDAWKTERLEEAWSGPELCVSVLGRSTDNRPVHLLWSVRLEGRVSER